MKRKLLSIIIVLPILVSMLMISPVVANGAMEGWFDAGPGDEVIIPYDNGDYVNLEIYLSDINNGLPDDWFSIWVDGELVGNLYAYDAIVTVLVPMAPGSHIIRFYYEDYAQNPGTYDMHWVLTEFPIPTITIAEDLESGAILEILKEIDVPGILPPDIDIYFLADTTGSMGGPIATIKAQASTIMTTVLLAAPNAQFGVGNYKDYPYDGYAYQHQLSITADTGAVQTAINGWSGTGGYDLPEAQLYALDQIANVGVGWRLGTTKVLVWFGDNPGHDPVPIAATSLGYDITEATATADLVNAGIKVIAISTTTGVGLDADPTGLGGDYAAVYSIVEDGSAGQGTNIAAATGGVHLTGVTSEDIADAILEGLFTTDVWWEYGDIAEGLNVDLDPEAYLGFLSGNIATFNETISVDIDVTPSNTLKGTVLFYADNWDVEFPDGILVAVQEIIIHVVPVPVDIDIKPWSWPNSVNRNNKKGVVPVAILGSATLDLETLGVDTTTLVFGPDAAWPTPSGDDDTAHDMTNPLVYDEHLVYSSEWGDEPWWTSNEDSLTDLVMHFELQEITGLGGGYAKHEEVDVYLTGRFADGRYFQGMDVFSIVK